MNLILKKRMKFQVKLNKLSNSHYKFQLYKNKCSCSSIIEESTKFLTLNYLCFI